MDRFKRYHIVLILMFFIGLISCSKVFSKKTGCPGEDAAVKVDKKGNPTSKPKSGLFDKKMTKKVQHK